MAKREKENKQTLAMKLIREQLASEMNVYETDIVFEKYPMNANDIAVTIMDFHNVNFSVIITGYFKYFDEFDNLQTQGFAMNVQSIVDNDTLLVSADLEIMPSYEDLSPMVVIPFIQSEASFIKNLKNKKALESKSLKNKNTVSLSGKTKINSANKVKSKDNEEDEVVDSFTIKPDEKEKVK